MRAFCEFFEYRPSLFSARKYKIIVAIVLVIVIEVKYCPGQELNSYRTINSGQFQNIAIWQRYDGTAWVAATVKPNRTNDIYVENPHLVTLAQNEEVKSVFLNADAGAAQKLNLNNLILDIYGSLNGFAGAAPGTPRGSFLANDWIGNSVDSRLVFKGASRTIIVAGAWSAQNTNSRYTVIFDPDDGAELVVERPFKANQFIFRNGKVIQQILVGGECATFSFNTNFAQFPGIYGNLIIESGGTLESECNSNISLRSVNSNTPSALFDLRAGGVLTLLANNPQIHAADIRFNGTVRYAGSTGTQNFVTSTFTGSMVQRKYHNLEFSAPSTKLLPDQLFLSGNFLWVNGGPITDANTVLHLVEGDNQILDRVNLEPLDLIVDKSGGNASFMHNLRIRRNFSMQQGSLDFMGNNLNFNTETAGTYTYTAGRWMNLVQMVHSGLPGILTRINATFPFYDDMVRGVRSLTLLGETGGDPSDLTINHIQVPDINYSAGFEDNDGTPILYKANSYFEIEQAPIFTGPLEMQISSDDLIVVEPEHIRIVSDEEAAPGNHLEGIEREGEFLARRDLIFTMLQYNTFTIGSTNEFSVLPITWLAVEASAGGEGISLKWVTAKEENGSTFAIYRSVGGVGDFKLIGEKVGKGSADEGAAYEYQDTGFFKSGMVYYRILYLTEEGIKHYSPLFRASWTQEEQKFFKLYPIPYESGPLTLQLVENVKDQHGIITVYDKRGNIIWAYEGVLGSIEEEFVNNLKLLSSGLYLIQVLTASDRQTVKWIRK